MKDGNLLTRVASRARRLPISTVGPTAVGFYPSMSASPFIIIISDYQSTAIPGQFLSCIYHGWIALSYIYQVF